MSTDDAFFLEFLRITRYLNSRLDIIPILFGSLGLQIVSGVPLYPQDIDILVSLSLIKDNWNVLKQALENLGYQLIDLHEHEFRKGGIKVAFSFEEDLWGFAGINHKRLEIITYAECRFRQLSLRNFLNVYTQSVKDGYRRTKDNSKDVQKIQLITNLLATRRINEI